MRPWLTWCFLLIAGCAPPLRPALAPAALIGTFEDDYGSRYTITAGEWTHHPLARYHVARWNTAGRYVIVRNDANNPSEPGLWTRIDYVMLPDMDPYAWAFCLSTYDAPSAEVAEASRVARPETPRTGCGGHPFTRMKRVPERR